MNILFLLLFLTSKPVDSAKILGFFYFPSLSHQNAFRPIWKELSLRGHEVTVITTNPTNDPKLINLTEIDVSVGYEIFKTYDYSNLRRDVLSVFKIQEVYIDSSHSAIDLEMGTQAVQDILKLPEDHFDLILLEVHMPCLFGIQHKFKAPLIAFSSLNTLNIIHNWMGNPIHPILYPDWIAEVHNSKMNILDKLDSLYVSLGIWFVNEFYYMPREDQLARKYFGQDMPYIGDMMKNTSLLFLNVNPILSERRPYVPNVMDYSLNRIEKVEPLPEDLAYILDNTENGVVYFSLGTNVRLSHVEGDIKDTIMKTLGDLPYTVLCKWDTEDVPNKPRNVVLRKWFNQNSVLAHPNVKVFVSQGGIQSAEEAIANGVPMVIIPFLADQFANARILTMHGMAETVSLNVLNKDVLKNAILKIAVEAKYRLKAKELASIFLDQPQSGVDKIIWWCEYVIRHKGAEHLRSPGADIRLYEYFMLDILAVVLAALLIIYMVVKRVYVMFVMLQTGATKIKDN